MTTEQINTEVPADEDLYIVKFVEIDGPQSEDPFYACYTDNRLRLARSYLRLDSKQNIATPMPLWLCRRIVADLLKAKLPKSLYDAEPIEMLKLRLCTGLVSQYDPHQDGELYLIADPREMIVYIDKVSINAEGFIDGIWDRPAEGFNWRLKLGVESEYEGPASDLEPVPEPSFAELLQQRSVQETLGVSQGTVVLFIPSPDMKKAILGNMGLEIDPEFLNVFGTVIDNKVAALRLEAAAESGLQGNMIANLRGINAEQLQSFTGTRWKDGVTWNQVNLWVNAPANVASFADVEKAFSE